MGRSEQKNREDGAKSEKQIHWMRISKMTDQQGIWIEDKSASGKKPPLDDLEHHVRRKERQVGKALKTWVKLT